MKELVIANSNLSRLENIENDDAKVCYYTGFSSIFEVFYEYLGPAADHPSYLHDGPTVERQVKRCRSRTLPPLE